MTAHLKSALAVIGLALALTACVSNPALDEGNRLVAEGRIDDAVQVYDKAMRERPGDRELRQLYFKYRDILIAQLMSAADAARTAGRGDEAEAAYRRVLQLDPNHARAANGLVQLTAKARHDAALKEAEALLKKGDAAGAEIKLRAVLTDNPSHGEARNLLRLAQEQAAKTQAPARAIKGPFSQPITLEFRDANLRTVFEVISRTSGINFVFDRDVRPDAKVTVFVRNTTLDDVIRLILVTNQLERKVINDNSVLIYPNTPAKNREYQELVVRSFYLANADAKQAQALVKSMVKTRDVFIDEKLNLLVVRDSADAVRLVEKLLESLDIAEPEVMLEMEVIEINRSKLQELGLDFPDYIGYGLLEPTTTSTVITTTGTQTTTNLGGQLAAGFINLEERGGLVPYVTNPAVVLNIKKQLSDSNTLANPRIRVKNREKAKVHIGEKLPVFTTTSTANVGVSASVSYLDVGLKLDVEPTVQLEDEVIIKVALEVSAIVKEVAGPTNSLAYQVGTRTASTTLRLRSGETQVLAGLIADDERTTASKVPGLGDIPLLGRLFSSNRDSAQKTEIVLLITPRILRNIARPEAVSLTVPSGTEAAAGAAPLQIQSTAPRSLEIASRSPAATPAATAPPLPRPVPDTTAPPPIIPGVSAPGPTSVAEAPSLALAAPAQATLGGQFAVAATLTGSADVLGAQVDVAYDASQLELVGGAATPGSATLTLTGPPGGLRGELRFRAVSLNTGATQVRVAASRLTNRAGATQVIPPEALPPPATVNLVR